jgi:MFS family permease
VGYQCSFLRLLVYLFLTHPAADNIGLSIFYIMYAFTEVPSNLMLKRVGAAIWSTVILTFHLLATDCFAVPTLVLAFGLTCFSTAFIKNFGGFMTVRVFLGLAEGGMMPGVAYYLSMWYTRNELAMRIGIFGGSIHVHH